MRTFRQSLREGRGEVVYRGHETAAEAAAAPRRSHSFGGVYASTSRAAAEQYGKHVVAYRLSPRAKLLDMDSSFGRTLASAHFHGEEGELPHPTDELPAYQAELHMTPQNHPGWSKRVRAAGYHGTRFGEDVFLHDPKHLTRES